MFDLRLHAQERGELCCSEKCDFENLWEIKSELKKFNYLEAEIKSRI